MLAQNITDACLRELTNTASDLLVGLKCLDAPEVVRQARLLKDRADECEALMLRRTAHKIEQVALIGNLDAAQLLIAELKMYLQPSSVMKHPPLTVK